MRWFIYVPEIDPDTFLFFFEKGTTGRSWSLRRYGNGPPSVRYAREFPWTAQEVLAMARPPNGHRVEAEAYNTNDLAWYELRIAELNRKHLGPIPPTHEDRVPETEGSRFPILDLEQLMASPKAGKRDDLKRMFISRQSEDYVTWNLIRALDRRPATDWWPELLALVAAHGGSSALPADQPPQVKPWRLVLTPPAYERSSRARMSQSGNPAWIARLENPDPVEGKTEVDLVFEGSSYLVFVEAKLNSDIGWTTTYDPTRNQIARNIDCLIEQVGDREPYFWMFVKDTGPGRGYVQLLQRYRQNPSELEALLPHRDPALLAEIAGRTALIPWSELLALLPDDEETAPIRSEVERRLR